jgi:hypothetical protein
MAAPEALEAADSVPHVAPAHPAPVSVHVTPLFNGSFVTVAVKLCAWLVCTDTAVGFTPMLTGGAGTTVIVVKALLLPSATDCAVAVTVAGTGTAGGAVYVIAAPEALDAADSVPQVAPAHPAPVSVHATPLFSGSFVTVAVRLCVWLVWTEAAVGFTLMPAGGGATIVIVVSVVLLTSATALAVTVTVAGEGTAAGAVYVIAAPEALEVPDKVPQVAPEQPAPVSVHATPLFNGSFCTVAVMLCEWLVCTEAAVGFTLIPTGGGATTVIVVSVVLLVSATALAVTVTVAGEGTAAGAV